jgi:hypothetical protein
MQQRVGVFFGCCIIIIACLYLTCMYAFVICGNTNNASGWMGTMHGEAKYCCGWL